MEERSPVIVIYLVSIIGLLFAVALFFPLFFQSESGAHTQTVVNIEHAYREGLHAYAGEISVPTPCDALGVAVALSDSVVMFEFSTITTTETCEKEQTPRRFYITFQGGEEVLVRARIDDEEARLVITEGDVL